MYDTCSIKNEWRTVFCCGNKNNPQDVILILGSCRVVPYLNYCAHANDVLGNPFKIYAIDPINYQIDAAGNMLDTRGLLKALETNEHFLSILRETTIFIHEGLSSFGILNTIQPAPGDTWEKPVWIYDFGLTPRVDVNIPNLHDTPILANDVIALHPEFQNRELTADDELQIIAIGDEQIERFMGVCDRTSFPEFGPWFRASYAKVRLFHSFNHVASGFTKKIFELANEKFLHLDLPPEFWASREFQHDMYANNSTPVTALDRKYRAYEFA